MVIVYLFTVKLWKSTVNNYYLILDEPDILRKAKIQLSMHFVDCETSNNSLCKLFLLYSEILGWTLIFFS